MKTTAKRNPIGLPVSRDTVVVRVGSGQHTHVYDKKDGVLCKSGKNAGNLKADGTDNRGKEQKLYESKAQMVTCYRCQKLVKLNLSEDRAAWVGPKSRL